ncbi:MAG TPA: sugar phosphate isomerase/epimerase family protein [Clostridia bacterium]|nr:sugar phosphate isomerase/epimerase family protein [Clostridia bacterium]
MRLLQYEVPLGISLTHQGVQSIPAFVEAGFTHFELGLPSREGGRGEEEKLAGYARPFRDALKEYGLCPWSMHLPFGAGWDIAHFDEQERLAVCASLKKLIDLTGNWGAKVYVLHGCLEPVAAEQRPIRVGRSIKSMQELDAHARRYGMRIALENLPRSCLANNAEETYAMMQAAGDPPICFDVNHLLQEDHATFLNRLAPYIMTTHLSDYDAVDERHWIAGRGVVPWRLLVERLQAAGYRGPYLFEIGPRPDKTPYSAVEVREAFRNAVEGN